MGFSQNLSTTVLHFSFIPLNCNKLAQPPATMTHIKTRLDISGKTVGTLGNGVKSLEAGMDSVQSAIAATATSITNLTKVFYEMQDTERALPRGKSAAYDGVPSTDAFTFPSVLVGASPVFLTLSLAKLELSGFTDPTAYITRTERFFHVDNTHDDLKLEYVLAIDWPVLHWLQWLNSDSPNLSWTNVVELLKSSAKLAYKLAGADNLADKVADKLADKLADFNVSVSRLADKLAYFNVTVSQLADKVAYIKGHKRK
ncbi:hypothetical protein OROGR_012954 [Orobanche gracilis]